MDGIWYYAIAFIVIWLIAFIFKNSIERFGIEVNFPVIMWKTKRLRGFINKIANLAPRFWKMYMNLGIAVSVICMAFMLVSLIYSLNMIMDSPAVSLIIPGVEVPGSPIFIPFFYGFVALATVLIVHEFSHGILARVENINIKSIGLLLFIILPGAFVEPDESEMNECSRPSKLRVYAAGSIANFSLAAIAMVLMIVCSSIIVPAVFNEEGIEINRVVSDSPADGYLKEGMIIQSINDYEINNSDSYVNAVSTLKPNSIINIGTNQGNFSLKGSVNPNNQSLGYIGIQSQSHYSLNQYFDNQIYSPLLWVLIQLPQLFMWIYFLNFAVGSFNLLPMKPLDGGYIFENLMSYIVSDTTLKYISTFLTALVAIIIIFSLIYGFFA